MIGLAVSCVCTACTSLAGAADTTTSQSGAVATFLRSYVRPDGRVVRTDQGADTVSEGQAYALLIAVATADRSLFASVWGWTQRHLQRPDHLLAYRWVDGRIADDNPAPDADLDVAAALLQAADTFDDEAYRAAGTAISRSVLTYETVTASPGTLVTAGTWAVGNPATLNPSYLTPGEATFFTEQTGDTEWNSVAAATQVMDRDLAAASPLPPDWATLAAGASAAGVTASASPDGTQSARYGMDAPRLVIRLAASRSASDRAMAASYAPALGHTGEVGNRSLDGAPLVTWRNAVTDVALYAARSAAGDTAGAHRALSSAEAQEASYPTYYGSAWVALAPLMLDGSLQEFSS